ncbi:MAG TPA: 1-deoxy-D-xylulose-5-phosphate reductoisomerase [Aminobacterium sp.]|uniref:1-deoxy-D-xylulose-5-phosphate reductoisomerase n=1 Tax=Aminobacterium TaxID=81466 RepID=UPI000EBEFFB8|nr:1-deoxy-D-xylulose-5-phosphate reductoisomerase [Aminobacterium sp. UBA4834]HCA40537.1 1-deoxy-D-xylulose-5-phosphate reductoisomerase [Aminobacterium sp.]
MKNRRIKLAVIGATGSVGSAVLDVCRAFPDSFEVVFLAAHSAVKKMINIAQDFHPEAVVLTNPHAASLFKGKGCSIPVFSGNEALYTIATHPHVDHVVFASSGTAAIKALQGALKEGKEVSLANKESIVVGGPWVMPLVKRDSQLRPLDSEHNAIWQCLRGEMEREVSKIYLTASGGPFRTFTHKELESVTPSMAIAHPVWSMGHKLSIDSATLMNKGIELIEAMFLFRLQSKQVDAVISPGSVVHGVVQFIDGSMKMLASTPDMRLSAASALGYPERLRTMSFVPELSLKELTINFYPPNEKLFPCLALAKEAARKLGPYPALLIGADEGAIEAFVKNKITFTQIPLVIEKAMALYNGGTPTSLDECIEISQWAQRSVQEITGGK